MDVLLLQNDDPGPPVLRRHSSSDISKQKFGTMPLVPIRGDESNSSMLSANQTLVRVQLSAVSQTCSGQMHKPVICTLSSPCRGNYTTGELSPCTL